MQDSGKSPCSAAGCKPSNEQSARTLIFPAGTLLYDNRVEGANAKSANDGYERRIKIRNSH